ncbi:MAG: hypothetical protein K2H14_01025, partial [Muribaculaceae bacterium]|nr:hypothetical protein [Muribaculaceae bacterium]
MRNFTFLVSATVAASMACAAPMAKNELKTEGTTAPKVTVSSLNGKTSSAKVQNKQSAAMKMARSQHKAAKRSAAPITSEVVEDFPEGSVSKWSRSSEAAELFWGYPYEYTDAGLAVDMVEDSDGKIWMNQPFSQYPVPGKYYAVKNGDMLTIPGGQCVIEAYDWDEEELVNYYLIAMELGDDGEYHAADNLDYNLVNDNGSWKSENPALAFGLASWNEDSQSYSWVGESEFNLVYTPQIHTLLEVPADLSVEKWAYVDEETGDGFFVNVGVKDNVIYLQGLYKNIPDAWMKLALDGETATFTGQFMGKDIENYHYAYLMPGRVEEEWDEEWEYYVNVLYATEKIEFTYDAENKVLATESAIIFSTVADAVFTVAEDPYLFQPRIAIQNRVAGTPPANPTDIYLSP